MTTKQARTVLGSLAQGISDEQIEKDLEVAQVLKALFFSHNLKKDNTKLPYNKNKHGKA